MKLPKKLQSNGKSRIKQLTSTLPQFAEFWMMKSLNTGFEVLNNLEIKISKDSILFK